MADNAIVRRSQTMRFGNVRGAGFSLLAAADTGIRDRVAFLTCFAPFGSLRTLALDIGSGTTEIDGIRRAWDVDQLPGHVRAHADRRPGLDDEAARVSKPPGSKRSPCRTRQR
ncbi:MAG: hypothetical protein R2848_01675 [Thermomicrobiales bacterium]